MSAAQVHADAQAQRQSSPDDAGQAGMPLRCADCADQVAVAQLRAVVVAPYVALVLQGARLGNAARLMRARAQSGLLDAASATALAALGYGLPSFRTVCRWMRSVLAHVEPRVDRDSLAPSAGTTTAMRRRIDRNGCAVARFAAQQRQAPDPAAGQPLVIEIDLLRWTAPALEESRSGSSSGSWGEPLELSIQPSPAAPGAAA